MANSAGVNRIYLVRHGRTAWNLQLRYAGQTDLPLDARGHEQADLLATRLAGVRFDAAYASDLLRARETARHILAGRDTPLVVDKRLREAAFGLWEGLTFAEVQARFHSEARAWLADPSGTAPPGGESLASMATRVTDAIGEILAAGGGRGREILIVTHGGPARVLLCKALGLAVEEHWRFDIEPGGLALLELHGKDGILCGLFPPGDGSREETIH